MEHPSQLVVTCSTDLRSDRPPVESVQLSVPHQQIQAMKSVRHNHLPNAVQLIGSKVLNYAAPKWQAIKRAPDKQNTGNIIEPSLNSNHGDYQQLSAPQKAPAPPVSSQRRNELYTASQHSATRGSPYVDERGMRSTGTSRSAAANRFVPPSRQRRMCTYNDECKESFTRPDLFLDHLARHKNPLIFSCGACGILQSSAASLARHKKYRCKVHDSRSGAKTALQQTLEPMSNSDEDHTIGGDTDLEKFDPSIATLELIAANEFHSREPTTSDQGLRSNDCKTQSQAPGIVPKASRRRAYCAGTGEADGRFHCRRCENTCGTRDDLVRHARIQHPHPVNQQFCDYCAKA